MRANSDFYIFSTLPHGWNLLAKSNNIYFLLITELKLGIRHIQVALLFLAMLFAYSMRVNMSMAIVAMTDTNNENVSLLI